MNPYRDCLQTLTGTKVMCYINKEVKQFLELQAPKTSFLLLDTETQLFFDGTRQRTTVLYNLFHTTASFKMS